jgi:hypothetical protein
VSNPEFKLDGAGDVVETGSGSYEISIVGVTSSQRMKKAIRSWMWQAHPIPCCLLCGAVFDKGRKPASLALAKPMPPRAVVVKGICKVCAATGNVKARTLLAFKKSLRVIDGRRA